MRQILVANNPSNGSILCLDVGTVRIGVAVARLDVRFANALETLTRAPAVFDQIAKLAADHNAQEIVVGWPRGLDGQETQQTRDTEAFVDELQHKTGLRVYLQDEALTSQKAEAELDSRHKPYEKSDVDALAAVYILEDYLHV